MKPLPYEVNGNPNMFVADMAKPGWDAFFMGLAYYYCTRSPDQQTKTGCVIVDWPTKMPIGLGYNGHPRGVDGLPTMREGSVLPRPGLLSITILLPPKIADKTANEDRSFVAIGAAISGYTSAGWTAKVFHVGEVVPPEYREAAKEHIQPAPDKYPTMIHCDTNAIVNAFGTSDHAVGYLPFEPCENCFLAWLAKSDIKFRRIVILSSRPMPNFTRLLQKHNASKSKGEQIVIEVMGPLLRDSRASGQSPSPAFDPAAALFQAAQYANLMIEKSEDLSRDSAQIYRK